MTDANVFGAAAETAVRAGSRNGTVFVTGGGESIVLDRRSDIYGEEQAAQAVSLLRRIIAEIVAGAVEADRARRRWSWLPGYRRLAWGENIVGSGVIYRNGFPTDLAATEIVTAFGGFGYCRFDRDHKHPNGDWRPGGTGTCWGLFRFVPDREPGELQQGGGL